MHQYKRLLSWLILVSLVFQILGPLTAARVYAASPDGPGGSVPGDGGPGSLGIAQTQAEHPIQALFIYDTDSDTANAVRSTLQEQGC